ncbi:RING/U-box superfamily protein [Striga hermonthica]|uniref:RING/U-box superfamily protein n=1 Tax=Striga hermonthica TaxID=68872 RepID=A0A9N7NRR0_STRHE|nr:RING/U-box superfamily protein [Striga hermonthica]
MESDASDFASNSSPSGGRGTGRLIRSRAMRFVRSPVSSLIEYSGVVRLLRPDYYSEEALPLVAESSRSAANGVNPSDSGNSPGEVSIRILGEQDGAEGGGDGEDGVGLGASGSMVGDDGANGDGPGASASGDAGNREGSSQRRYDVRRAARWVEQVLPFTLLLLIVFIRQHLQGFVVTIFSTIVLCKSDDVLRKQTALKGERKITVLVGYSAFLMLHILGIYWCNWSSDLFLPLLMIPPKAIPPFWHAIFIILVNDIMARLAAMILKFLLLLYYKNGKAHNFRRQGQILTLVEYALLLYRSLLPTPVWYKFFLNKDYGSLFSSVTTGLYLTFKLTSIVEKVRSLFAASKALSRKEVHYGSRATPEQVNAAGDLCTICQEKLQTPIVLRCKHIFCEDCVSEWFERERTCPLCRSMVRPADLKSYGDGSTSLYFQIF